MSGAETTLRMILLGEDKSASKTVAGLGTEAEKSGGKLQGMGKMAAGVFAGGALFEGAQKGIEFLKGSVEAAVQDQQNNAILERQLKNTTGATNEQISATEDWIQKTAEASGTAKTDLTPTLTKLATVTGSVGKAQKLTTLAMNVAAGTHQKLSSITAAFVRAQNGSVGGLSRLGIATKNADGTSKTFLQTQKEMAKQFKGDTAAAADTAAGKAKRLSVTWEIMKEEVGEKLLPVLTSLATFVLNVLLPGIGKLSSFLSAKLGPPIRLVVGLVKNDLLGAFTSFQQQGPSKFSWVHKTFAQVAAIVRQYMALVRAEIHDGTVVIEFIWKHFGSVIIDQLRAVWSFIKTYISGALKIIQGILKVATSLLRGDWKGAWDGIKMILVGVWQIIRGIVKLQMDTLKNIVHAGLIGLKLLASAGLHLLVAEFKAIPGQIIALGGLFMSAGKALIAKLFAGIVAGAKAGVGFVADLVGAVKNAINSSLHLPLVVSFDKGPVHIHATVIPALARGGIVRARPGGTMILAGEGGADEAVVPLDGRHGFGAVAGGGSQDLGTFTLDLKLDGRTTQKVLLKLKRENGGLALGLA